MGYIGKVQIDNGTAYSVASTLYGTCDTAANVADKIVVCNDFDQLITGVSISVNIKNENSITTGATLNVNSTGAKPIKNIGNWTANSIVIFVYDGSNWTISSGGTGGGGGGGDAPFIVSTTAPSNTKVLWINPSTDANKSGLFYHNGTTWVSVPVCWS